MMQDFAKKCSDALSIKVDESDFTWLGTHHQKSQAFMLNYSGKCFFVKRYLQKNSGNERRVFSSGKWSDVLPELYFLDSELLITEWIFGSHPSYSMYQDFGFKHELSAILDSIHHCQGDDISRASTCLEKSACIIQHVSSLNVVLPQELLHLQQLLGQENYPYEQQTLIHGDLNYKNILIGTCGRMYCVDWSDCGLGHPYEDYAEVSIFYSDRHQFIGDMRIENEQAFHYIFKARLLWFALWAYQEGVLCNRVSAESVWRALAQEEPHSFFSLVKHISSRAHFLKEQADYFRFAWSCIKLLNC
jgi:hypothetical protein